MPDLRTILCNLGKKPRRAAWSWHKIRAGAAHAADGLLYGLAGELQNS